ncbi:hypothetical protein [uncultured Sphaerochaeta sp.]|uniref:hypothetical protein n=1 Tax=uncultured Sphaerochaeta sp. TaxID=886478 RepID=UPI002A0A305D|nr:hypothetical protein [uncultured Sphaerochaeta sp.]
MKTTITLEVDLETLRKAEKILSTLPCTLDYAVNLLLEETIKEGMLPFVDTEQKQQEENRKLAYGEIDYQDNIPGEGLFDLGPEA